MGPSRGQSWTGALYADPVRRYMLPVFSDRWSDWLSHPLAERDSLHEHEMRAVEGLSCCIVRQRAAEIRTAC